MELKKSTETQWKGASKTSTDKTAAKIKVNHDWADSEWSFCNDKFSGDVSGSNDDKDYPMKFALKTESKPASNAWKVKLLWDASTPDFSGARFHENVSPLSVWQIYYYKPSIRRDLKSYLYFDYRPKFTLQKSQIGKLSPRPILTTKTSTPSVLMLNTTLKTSR